MFADNSTFPKQWKLIKLLNIKMKLYIEKINSKKYDNTFVNNS